MECPEQGGRAVPSPYGLGVLSPRSFAIRELLGPVRGAVMDDPDYESEYCMEVRDQKALEPDWPFRLVNHRCRPNCRLLELEADRVPGGPAGLGVLWLEVLRDIAPCDQITIDCGWPASVAVPCWCGCPECRGWIVASAERARREREAVPRDAAQRPHAPADQSSLAPTFKVTWYSWTLPSRIAPRSSTTSNQLRFFSVSAILATALPVASA